MSADNWTRCPQCGKEDTLREDYEIGIYNGVFHVSYGAKCYYDSHKPGCGFVFSYIRNEPVTLNGS